MFTTNFTDLFEVVTQDIGTYLMFLSMVVLLYILVGSLIRLISDSIIHIVYVIRAPLSTPIQMDNEESSLR